MEKKEEKQKEEAYSLVQVPTQLGIAFKTPEGENITTEELLVRIANAIDELKKNLVG